MNAVFIEHLKEAARRDKRYERYLLQATPALLLRSLPMAQKCRHNKGKHADTKPGCGHCNSIACDVKGKAKLSECVNCSLWEASSLPSEHHEKPTSTVSNSWVRHLLFHIWPKKSSQGTWQRNLDQLKQRWSMFNGKRIIAIATDGASYPADAVKEYMRGYDCEWVEVENDATLREVKTFEPMFEQLEGLPGYIFYAQAKGVTKPINRGVSVHAWTAAMYELLLDFWPLVEESFKAHHVVGVFKKNVLGAFGVQSPSRWHYSGSFAWIKNSELWSRNWRGIERVWFGIETYPSMIFNTEEAGCLFHCKNSQFNLYSMREWARVDAELALWREANKAHRTQLQGVVR